MSNRFNHYIGRVGYINPDSNCHSKGVIYLEWGNFLTDIQYINYFKTDGEKWYDNLIKLFYQ